MRGRCEVVQALIRFRRKALEFECQGNVLACRVQVRGRILCFQWIAANLLKPCSNVSKANAEQVKPKFSFGLTSTLSRDAKTRHNSPLRDAGATAVISNNYKFQFVLTHSKAL